MDTIWFSVSKTNIEMFNTVVLNNISLPELPKLIHHHFLFFSSFNHIGYLNDLLTLRRGINSNIGSKIRKVYVSDINHIMRTQQCHRYIRFSEDFGATKACLSCKDHEDLEFYVASQDRVYFQEPTCDNYYIKSRQFVLPSFTDQRKKTKKTLCVNEDFIPGPTVQGEPLELKLEDLPGYGLTFTAEDKAELSKLNKWVLEHEETVVRMEQELNIARYGLVEVTHLNRTNVNGELLFDLLNEGEELNEVSSRYFSFIVGTKFLEKINLEEISENYGYTSRYIARRLEEMSCVVPEHVPADVMAAHKGHLAHVARNNDAAKDIFLSYLNSGMTKESLEAELRPLYSDNCLHRLGIRKLYTKFAYLNDEMLLTDTSYMREFDFPKFIKRLKRYFDNIALTKKILPNGLSQYVDSINISVNDQRKKGRNYATVEEKKEAARNMLEEMEEEHKALLEYANSIMGEEWTSRFADNFSLEAVKDNNPYYVKLKQEYNCLIRTRQHWTPDDKEYFYSVMREIYSYDEDFLKYLPAEKRKKYSTVMMLVKDNISFCNFACQNFGSKDKIVEPFVFKVEKKKRSILQTLSDVVIPALSKNEPHSTMPQKPDQRVGRAEELKSRAIGKLDETIDLFIEVHSHIGDALELTPRQLGLDTIMEASTKLKPEGVSVFEVHRNTTRKTFSEVITESETWEKKANKLELNLMRRKELNQMKVVVEKCEAEAESRRLLEIKKKQAWQKPKKVCSTWREFPKAGVNSPNRFDILYQDEEVIKDSTRFINRFLSCSDNLKSVFDWKGYKEAGKRMSQVKAENEFESRKTYNARLWECSVQCKKRTDRKYEVSNINKALKQLYLCYHYKVLPDLSYINRVYGLKRCQAKYVITSIKKIVGHLNTEKSKKNTKNYRRYLNL